MSICADSSVCELHHLSVRFGTFFLGGGGGGVTKCLID
jgi:hypothetical protein